ERWSACFGLEQERGRDPRALSAGRQQLVLLAAALASRPGLLIADEGGAHLDRAARALVMRALRCELDRGLALLWVSQSADEIAAADREVPLEGPPGHAAADGGLPPPATLASVALRIAV